MSDKPAVKAYTPWGLKFFITIFFVIVPAFMFALKAYEVDGSNYLYCVLDGFRNNPLALFIWIIAIHFAIAGIVLIWLNKPGISAIFAALLLAITISSLGMIWSKIVRVTVNGYIMWGSVLILIILVILALFLTKNVPVPEKPKPAKPVNPSISVADEIRKFKDLMDEGVITKEEFEEQKKRLLGQ